MAATIIVAERSLVCRVAGLEASGRVVTVPRERRRGRWSPLVADEVVDALEAAGPGAVVLARPVAVDIDAAALPGLARVLGREVVQLPADGDRAAWVIAVAVHVEAGDTADTVRTLQSVAGLAAAARQGQDGYLPAGARPGLVLRWARRSWRPCAHCGGGGCAGTPCGRCGGPIAVAA